jgi:tetratricopeptide (TPR) repeat protein/transglutaminase-like putative cysteine protease
MHIGQRVLLGLLTILLTAGAAFAGDSRPWEGDRFRASATVFQKAASDVTAPVGMDVVVLHEEQSHIFEADGRSTSTYYLVFKVITQNGADDWANISLNWEPWHEERPAVRARVITPDQVEHLLDPKTVADAAAHEQDSRIYSDRRVLRAPLPAVTPGAIVEEEFVEKESAPVFGAGTVSTFYFGRSVPVKSARLVLDAPASLPLQYRLQLLPDLKPLRTEENGRVRFVFEAGPLEPLANAPGYLPSDVPAFPHVTFSTGASWQKIAEEYGRIVDEKIATTDVRPQVSKLLAGKSSRDEKIAALVDNLNRLVRYTGIEFGEAAIVPHSPNETWNRKYGDCKDKSVLLVSLLRTAGVPAYIALLDSGYDQDVTPDLPGMGMFDHAIVFIPGTPDIWIDATDEYARPGQLPSGDQGRFALVARNGESALRTTPVSLSKDNLLVEKREFYLAENGPARIVETSEPRGSFESSYRRSYTDKDNKDNKEQLTNYVKSQYLADKLDRFDRSDPSNTSQQFQLVLETKSARRGFTDLESAVAAVRLETLFNGLPAELQQREKKEDSGEGSSTLESAKKRTADYQLTQAFATEWRYQIVPPAGFRAKPLPKNLTLALGPAILSEDFSEDKEGIVHAVFRFDTVKRRLSISEAAEMRNKVAELKEGQPVAIYFEPVAKALFTEGKIRESFQSYRSLIALHPKESVHHLQLAKALLEEGMGQAARDEARLAAKLEPASLLAEKTLADILEYDLVGRKFRPGSDYAGAEAAFREAKKLDPKDKEVVGNLGVLLEYSSDGERYASGAKLKDATAEYLSLSPDDLAEIGLKNNPAFTLLYAGEFAEALKYAETLNPRPTAVIVAAIANMSGSEAGMKEARKRTGNDEELKQVLKGAGEILMRLHKYPVAAELLQAGASGENASQTVSLASMLRRARPREELQFEDTPKGVVKKMFFLVTEPDFALDKLNSLSSRNALTVISETDTEELTETLNAGRQLRSMLSRTGLPADVMIDLMMPLLDPAVEGSDATGYRVTLRMPGSKDMVMFVVQENGHSKILDSSEKPNAIALEILDRVAANDLVAARQMLDWVRDVQHLAGGDDPFEGEAFPRFWTQGKDAAAYQMQVAAASILIQTKPTARKGIAILETARNNAPTDAERLNIDLALARGYFVIEDYAKGLPIVARLATQNPDSKRLFQAHALGLRGLGRWSELDRIAEERLTRKPQDIDATRVLIGSAEGRGDFKLAHSLGLKLVASGKAEASDLNNLAWGSLFTSSSDDDVETAVKAARMSQDQPGVLHTLGCVYAEVGKTREAREVLLQAMDKLNLDAPDTNYWYAFGRIAEQYGEREIAISLYSRVTKPKDAIQLPSSSYSLAQMRLRILGATDAASHKTTP